MVRFGTNYSYWKRIYILVGSTNNTMEKMIDLNWSITCNVCTNLYNLFLFVWFVGSTYREQIMGGSWLSLINLPQQIDLEDGK